jgi:flagellin-specific chaperone FliS
MENKKNYSQRDYMPEKFSFDLPGYGPLYRIEVDMDSPKFNPIKVPEYNPQFLVGIVNVDYDTDSISKEIGKDVFLGMEKYEIINNIKNKHKGRIWKYKGKDVYNYSANGQNAIIDLDSMIVDRRAKGGIAVILEVLNLPMMNETPIHDVFILKSICINDNSENLGIIRINDIEKAREIANKIEGPSYLYKQAKAFVEIAKNTKDINDIKKARKMASKRKDSILKTYAFLRIAEETKDVKDIEKAIKAANKIEKLYYQAKAFTDIAKFTNDISYIEKAREIASKIEDPYDQAEAFVNILRIFLVKGIYEYL